MKPISELKLRPDYDRPESWRPNIVRDIATKHFAWPGGYQKFAVTSDGAVLCARCVMAEYESVYRETCSDSDWSTGWKIVGIDYVLEYADTPQDDCAITCGHCGRTINLDGK